MTPMIDVVFQLLIFFIVTLTISDAKDKEVRLEFGPHGTEIDPGKGGTEAGSVALIIDVGPKGRVSINNIEVTDRLLHDTVRNRLSRMGNAFQIWIRGDFDVQHGHVKRVMDICTNAGVGRVHFVAVKDPRTPETKKYINKPRNQRR